MKAHKLIIDAMEDMVVITGRKDVMEKSLDLHLLPYIETEGFIVTQIHDPVPSRGLEIANAAINQARRTGSPGPRIKSGVTEVEA